MDNIYSPDPFNQDKLSGDLSDHSITTSRAWLRLADIMSKEVVTVSSTDAVVSAAKKMAKKRISCVMVMDNKEIKGILTETDFLKKVVTKGAFNKKTVNDVMTSPVESASSGTSIFDAGRVMYQNNIKRLPIVENGKLVGIVTQTNLTRALASYDMWRNVEEIMVKNIATIDKKETVLQAANIMKERDISCIVVMDKEWIAGVLTERDLQDKIVATEKDPSRTKLDKIMTSSVITVPPTCSILNAVKIIEEKKIRRLVVTENDQLCGLITQTDIFKAIKQKLESEEQKNIALLEKSPNSIYTADLNGKVTYVNPAFMKLFEVTIPLELLNKPLLPEKFWTNPKDRDLFMDKLKQAKGVEVQELALKTAKGRKIYVTLFSTFTKNTQGQLDGSQGILHDITEKKELVTLRKAEEVLRERNKMLQELSQMKSDFVSMVSHELRTPLTVTKEALSQITDEILGKINDDQRDVLDVASMSIERLIRLINDLLDVAKIESGKIDFHMITIDLVELSSYVIASFKPQAVSKGLELKLESSSKKIEICADRDRIIQVFTNLMGNAMKFTEKGGISISLKETQNGIECAVEDTGMGMDKEDLPKVFEKFKQVSSSSKITVKGTGLGLSIAKGIVELHGGKIWVESELDKGTSFIFTLPKNASS